MEIVAQRSEAPCPRSSDPPSGPFPLRPAVPAGAGHSPTHRARGSVGTAELHAVHSGGRPDAAGTSSVKHAPIQLHCGPRNPPPSAPPNPHQVGAWFCDVSAGFLGLAHVKGLPCLGCPCQTQRLRGIDEKRGIQSLLCYQKRCP